MTLARKIDKEKFDKYHETIQAEYELVGDEYFLQTSGLVPKEKVTEFRDNNIVLKQEKEKLEARVDFLGDMTEKEFKDLKVKAEAGGEGLSDKEKEELVTAEVNKRIVALNEDNEKVVTGLQTENKTLNTSLEKALIDTKLQGVAINAKVKPEAISDFISRGKSVFKIINGKETPVDTNGKDILYGKDGQTPLLMNDWAAGLFTDAPHLFKESSGANGRHRQQSSSGANDSKATGGSRMANARRNA